MAVEKGDDIQEFSFTIWMFIHHFGSNSCQRLRQYMLGFQRQRIYAEDIIVVQVCP